MKTKITVAIVLLLGIAAIVLYPKLVVTLSKDGADAKLNTFKDTYGHRYTEMFLIGGNAITKNLAANVYNTWGLNGSDTTGDSCPAPLLDKIDVKEMAKQYHMLAVSRTVPASGRWTGSRSRWARNWTSAA